MDQAERILSFVKARDYKQELTMIKNIIFDIGNVLVDYCWREHIARFGFTGETLERIGDAMMRSPQWNERSFWRHL